MKALFVLLLTASLFADSFENFTTANSGLVSNNVKAVVIDDNGIKWFGTDNGLCAFDGRTWTLIQSDGAKQTLAGNDINDLVVESGSFGPELWIATTNGASVMGISSIDAVTKATPYRADNTDLLSNMVTSVAVDPLRDEKWFGTPIGVSRFSSAGWTSFTTETNPPLAWDDVTDIGVDADSGWIYICTKNGPLDFNGVSRLHYTSGVDAITAPSPYNVEWSGLYSGNVFTVFMDVDGTQWFGTDAGFAYHDTTETKAYWDVFTVDEGLINDQVNAILKSKEGMAWIGTAGGLDRFDYQFGEYGIEIYSFTHFTTADGLADNYINDMAMDMDGSLWLATTNGVSHYTGKTGVTASRVATTPKTFGFIGNYPNPFNPTTSIGYQLSERSHVELYIVDITGKRIRTLVSTTQSRGTHTTTWNGRLEDGMLTPSGIYLAVLEVAGEKGFVRDSLKMLLAK